MFDTLKRVVRSWFFPNDKYTIQILNILNKPGARQTFAAIFRLFQPSCNAVGRLAYALDRAEAGGLIVAKNLSLSNPPHLIYEITDQGRQVIDEWNRVHAKPLIIGTGNGGEMVIEKTIEVRADGSQSLN